MEDLNMSEEMAVLGLSVYVLGFGLGPLVFAPLSEVRSQLCINLTRISDQCADLRQSSYSVYMISPP